MLDYDDDDDDDTMIILIIVAIQTYLVTTCSHVLVSTFGHTVSTPSG